MASDISVVIPAYNAEKHLRNVLNRFPEELWRKTGHVYIINDGSTDGTGDIITELEAEYHCITAVNQPVNHGYGSTVQAGLRRCVSDGCAFAACLHADGQYPPELIVRGTLVMEQKKLDLLQGSRIASGTALSGGMPLYKYIAGRVLTALENLVFGLSMTDYHSGFLIYGRRVLSAFDFRYFSRSFDFDLEVIASARSAGFTIGEIPIPTRYADEKSYLNPAVYGLRVLGVVARYISGRYRGYRTEGNV